MASSGEEESNGEGEILSQQLSQFENEKDFECFRELMLKYPKPHEHLREIFREQSTSLMLLRKLISFVNGNSIKTVWPTHIADRAAATLAQGILHLSGYDGIVDSALVGEMTAVVITELKHFSSDVLVSAIDSSLKFIGTSDKETSPRWIDVVGKMITVMMNRSNIRLEGDTIDGNDYTIYVINRLCTYEWTSGNAASIIALLREIHLTPNQIDMVLHTTGTCLMKTDWSTPRGTNLPSFVYQLIMLGEKKRPVVILDQVANYFMELSTAPRETESIAKKKEAFGTVVFHFMDAVRQCETLQKVVLTKSKLASDDQTVLENPLILAVCLGVTSITDVKTYVMNNIRDAIVKTFWHVQRANGCFWLQCTNGISVNQNVTAAFRALVEFMSTDLDFMLDGVLELCMALLDTDRLLKSHPIVVAEQAKQLSFYLLRSIVQNCPEVFTKIIPHLMTRCQNGIDNSYSECISMLCSQNVNLFKSPRAMMKLERMVANFTVYNVLCSKQLTEAFMSILRSSVSLMNQVMLRLRKMTGYNSDEKYYAMNAVGILISNSPVATDMNCSLSQYSQVGSVGGRASSASVTFRKDNETFCEDLLSIVKPFLIQRYHCRLTVYKKLPFLVRSNPGVIRSVCYILLNQIEQLMTVGSKFKLSFEYETSGSLVPKESLGYLLQCISLVCLKGKKSFTMDEEIDQILKLSSLLDKWIENLLDADLDSLTTEAASASFESLSQALTQTQSSSQSQSQGKRSVILKTMKIYLTVQVTQATCALLEYLALGGSSRSDVAGRVNLLFGKLLSMENSVEEEMRNFKEDSKDNAKGRGKTGKAKADAIVSGTQATSSNGSDIKLTLVKLEYHRIITLESAASMLAEIYAIAQCREKYMNSPLLKVYKKEDFENFLLQTLESHFHNILKQCDEQLSDSYIIKTFSAVSKCLWDRYTSPRNSETTRVPEVINGTTQSPITLRRLEVLKVILKLLLERYPLQHSVMIARLVGAECAVDETNSDQPHNVMVDQFFTTWKRTVKRLNQSSCVSAEEELAALVDILKTLILLCDVSCNSRIVQISNFIWSAFVTSPFAVAHDGNSSSSKPSVTLMENVVPIILLCDMKSSKSLERIIALARHVHIVLGDADEEAPMIPIQKSMWLIDSETAPKAIYLIADFIITELLQNVNIVVNHISARSHVKDEDDHFKDRDSCVQTMHILVKVSDDLLRSEFPDGEWSKILLQLTISVFTAVTSLVDFFSDSLVKTKLPFNCKAFVNLVKFIGKEFKVAVDRLITRVEFIKRCTAEEKEKSSKSGKLASTITREFAKETKLVPEVVFVMEKYEQRLVALSNKSKIDLLAGSKLSSARDYRIDNGKMKTAFEERRASISKKKRPRPSDSMLNTTEGDEASTSAIDDSNSNDTVPLETTTSTTKTKRPSAAKRRKKISD